MDRLIYILLIFTIGCNQKLVVPKRVEIEPTLQIYVDNFLSEAKNQGKTIVIDNLLVSYSSHLKPTTLGECYMYDRGTIGNPTIHINTLGWDGKQEILKTEIMFHELGHCVLWREHISAWTNGIVSSIMYPFIQSPDMYTNNWDYYMGELFNGF